MHTQNDLMIRIVGLHKTYELGGPDVLDFKLIVNTILQAIGKKRLLLPVPIWAVLPVISLLQSIGFPVPVTKDQLIMLQEDNIRKGGDDIDELGIRWTGFEEGIRKYLE